MSLSPSQTLHNRYRIVQLLGQGGFGAVYRAWDLNLKRPCAVKENFDATPESARQFEQEAFILANLSHPNLPRVTDHFVLPGQGQYLVMDFVEGEDLQTKIAQRGGLPEHEVLPWIEQVCDALAYLHRQTPPIIHRDLKPANIRITPEGRAMLVDFGIAKRYEAQGKTTVGAKAITPGFSPPEQYGKGGTDARSDVYALGATLYAALTGQEPVESVQRTLGTPLPPPRQFNQAISLSLEPALLKAMALLPGERYPTAAAFKQALQPITTIGLAGGLTRNLGSVTTTTAPLPQKFPVAWLAGGVAVALGLFLMSMVGVWIFKGNAPTPLLPAIPLSGGGVGTDTPVPPLSATFAMQGTQQAEAMRQTEEANLAARETALAAGFLTQTAAPTPHTPPADTLTPETPGTRVSPVDGMTMVFVPAGEFLMGITPDDLTALQQMCPACATGDLRDAQPQQQIFLDGFWIDQTEVTNRQFAQFVQTGYVTTAESKKSSYVINPAKNEFDYLPNADWRHPHGSDTSIAGLDYPVTQISWDDANAYCQWAGRRLPTEAEWEKAARGPTGQLFPWGNQKPTTALANLNYSYGLTSVGSFPAGVSPYGVWDMVGNVREWVADFYQEDYYLFMPDRNPTGPATGEGHAMRGGAWASTLPGELFLAAPFFRLWNYADIRSDVMGFRCALDAEETPAPTVVVPLTPTPGSQVNPIDGAPLVFIPGGEFIMGITLAQLDTLMSMCPACNRSLLNHSRPTHPTQVEAFWLYQTEVTNAQYAVCVQAGNCPPPTKFSVSGRTAYYGNPDYAAYPVVYVTWYAADTYCQWAHGRLPTEAEWERAARGDDGRLFPWGDTAPTPLLANIDPFVGTTTAVGAYPGGASPYGVQDMAGNVWEWVADWYDPNYYLQAPLLNPLGPASSPEGQRAGRGGNWAWDNVYASAAYHDYWEPEKSGGAVGFRCMMPQE